MVSLAGLQLFDALILYVTGDNRIPYPVRSGRMNFQQGTVSFDRTLLDTQKSILHVNGQVVAEEPGRSMSRSRQSPSRSTSSTCTARSRLPARSAPRKSRSAASSRCPRR